MRIYVFRDVLAFLYLREDILVQGFAQQKLVQNLLDIGTSEVHHAKFGADLC